MSNVRILLDGTEYPLDGNVEGDFVVEHRIEDEVGNIAKSFGERITFVGEAFSYLSDKFVTNPNGKFERVDFTLIDNCCGDDRVIFEGAIFGENVEWCEGDCFLTVQAVQFDDYTAKVDCIRSTLIYDNHDGFQQQQHPRMTYCLEYRPGVLQDIVLIFGIILNLQIVILSPLIAAVATIVAVVTAVVNFLNALGANLTAPSFAGDGGVLAQISNLIQTVNSFIIGCGRRHPSPLVREYIDNVCRKCGIEWSSSIFKDPASDYYNTVLYNAPVEKGKRPILNPFSAITTWIDENKPIKTLDGFLTELGTVFNAKHRIVNGVLYFERKDFFNDNEEWVDYDTLKAAKLTDGVICYQWRQDDAAAVLRLAYQEDAVDWVGNEALPRFNNLIEWNIPVNARQKGIEERFMPFGTPRFRDDGIDRDVLGDYAWFPAYSGALNTYSGVLIQNNGTSFQPKLIIWDGQNINLAKARRYAIPGFPIDPLRNYNYPYNATNFGVDPTQVYPSNQPLMGIYGRFHAIDNPKILTDQGKQFTFDFKFGCDELDSFAVNKNVGTPIGSGRITSVRINYTRRTALVTGNV